MNSMHATCQSCRTSFAAEPKRTFLGFQKLTCPSCNAKVIYPLTRGYRITYWVIFAIMVITVLGAFAQGGIGFPGGLGIAVLIALLKDWTIQKRVRTSVAPKSPGQI